MSNNFIKTIEYKGYWIGLEYDGDAIWSPREDENLGTMVCAHDRYRLGDRMIGDGGDTPYLDTIQGFKTWIEKGVANGKIIALSLYLYDHGGLAISTRSWLGRAPHAEWDSGMVGYIYATREDILRVTGRKRLWPKHKMKVMEYLREEVTMYNQWMNGEIYCWSIWDEEPDENSDFTDCIDQCTGYYNEQDALADAHDAITYLVEQEKLKGIQLILPSMEEYLPEDAKSIKEKLEE